MAKLIITVEGGTITQVLNFLDRNIKDNRYVYGNGKESGIVDEPEEIYSDIPECRRITKHYDELLDAIDLGKSQITNIMRELNGLEKEMDPYVIPSASSSQQHVISLSNSDLEKLAKKVNARKLGNDKDIEEAIQVLIHKE